MNEVRERPHPSSENAVGKYAQQIFNYRQDIFLFMDDMWGLKPQPVKPEYQRDWEEVCRAEGETWLMLKESVTAEWFGDHKGQDEDGIEIWEWYEFEKGRHITWQQTLILMGIKKSKHPKVPSMISVVSGHGIGKSATCAWIVLWYLYCFQGAQVPVTAPTSSQMHDVLWKEMSIWIKRMPQEVQPLYEWTTGYVRIMYDPESWFARARTSTKENTEAIAGVHSEYVCIVVDEASGVPEQVFNTAEGALTSGNVIVILISNGTRTIGYFYDTHHKNTEDWQNFAFDGEQTPMVDRKYVRLQLKRHGRGSQEFTIRVSGGFPKEDAMDDSGYLQLISREKCIVVPKWTDEYEKMFVGRIILGVDPSGEGKDEATIYARDMFKAVLLDVVQSTNENEIAQRVLTWVDRLKVAGEDVVIDGFGIGTRIGQKIVAATKGNVNPYTALVGNAPKQEEKIQGMYFIRNEDEWQQSREDLNEADVEFGDNPYGDKVPDDLYLNIRALMYFRLRKWLIAGGQIVDNNVQNSDTVDELMGIRYMRALQGNKLQLMSKKEMLKLRIKSPNKADALALTMLRRDTITTQTNEERHAIQQEESSYDPHDIL